MAIEQAELRLQRKKEAAVFGSRSSLGFKQDSIAGSSKGDSIYSSDLQTIWRGSSSDKKIINHEYDRAPWDPRRF